MLVLLTRYLNHLSVWLLEERKGHIYLTIPECKAFLQCLTLSLWFSQPGFPAASPPQPLSQLLLLYTAVQCRNPGIPSGAVTGPVPILCHLHAAMIRTVHQTCPLGFSQAPQTQWPQTRITVFHSAVLPPAFPILVSDPTIYPIAAARNLTVRLDSSPSFLLFICLQILSILPLKYMPNRSWLTHCHHPSTRKAV